MSISATNFTFANIKEQLESMRKSGKVENCRMSQELAYFVSREYFFKFETALTGFHQSLVVISIIVDFHVKPRDKHLFLIFIFLHQDYTRYSIVFIQAWRVIRICSCEKDFGKHMENMKS